jgi:preprotein translocase subunit SecD
VIFVFDTNQPVSADTKSTVAVMDFENITGITRNDSLAKALTETIMVHLVKGDVVQLVERSQIKKIVEEQALGLTGLIDTKWASDVGKMLAARFLVIGMLSRVEKRWIVTTRLLEVETGRIITAEILEANTQAGILQQSKNTADAILQKIAGETDRSKKSVLVFSVQPKSEKRTTLSPDQKTKLFRVLRKKVSHYGASLENISMNDDRTIKLVVTALAEPLKLAEILMSDDVLEFRVVQRIVDTRRTSFSGDLDYLEYTNPHDGRKMWYAVRREAELSGSYIKNASVAIDNRYGQIFINIEFDREGTALLGNITKHNIDRQMAIVLNGTILMAPVIRAPITRGRAQISGDFNLDEAFRYVVNLKSGNLPARLSLEDIDMSGFK